MPEAVDLLRRIGTPAAMDALVLMFDDPAVTSMDDLRYLEAPLLAMEHPAIGPAALRWFRRCVAAAGSCALLRTDAVAARLRELANEDPDATVRTEAARTLEQAFR